MSNLEAWLKSMSKGKVNRSIVCIVEKNMFGESLGKFCEREREVLSRENPPIKRCALYYSSSDSGLFER
jgi:hypothetical protein